MLDPRPRSHRRYSQSRSRARRPNLQPVIDILDPVLQPVGDILDPIPSRSAIFSHPILEPVGDILEGLLAPSKACGWVFGRVADPLVDAVQRCGRPVLDVVKASPVPLSAPSAGVGRRC